ncbi:unnamed protein product [Coregonus sp. 'balchen']|nr:unnamed protein product [Coregonus sp. 'balchen']
MKALFVGEADIREHRVTFDELVKFISKNSTLATCPEVLEFLVKSSEEEEEDDDEYLGPLGNVKCTREKKKTPLQAKVATQPKFSLFDEDIDELFQPAAKDNLAGKVKLGDPLLLPTAYKDVASADSGLDEDADELFRIEDNFDKLLQVKKSVKAKPVPAPKPASKPKPALPVKPSSLASGDGGSVVDEVKYQMDILKYIQQN